MTSYKIERVAATATTSVDSPKPDPDTDTELDTNPNLNPNPNYSNSLVPASSNGTNVCLLKFAGDSAGSAFMGSIFRYWC
ncbi:unnamed protein product [Prunus armeniaca]|uniref:Uncharacterized protein n=1 Tax=Prunus armeniaca TaxID=36596 RepID=A0A6J5V8I1_PRUAR|nr:unnamed protein product [Prunus armeniaca]